MPTLDDRFRKLPRPEQQRIQNILQRVTERGFTPFPASEVSEQVARIRNAWASAAIEGIDTPEMDKVLMLMLIERRIPSKASTDILIDDLCQQPANATAA